MVSEDSITLPSNLAIHNKVSFTGAYDLRGAIQSEVRSAQGSDSNRDLTCSCGVASPMASDGQTMSTAMVVSSIVSQNDVAIYVINAQNMAENIKVSTSKGTLNTQSIYEPPAAPSFSIKRGQLASLTSSGLTTTQTILSLVTVSARIRSVSVNSTIKNPLPSSAVVANIALSDSNSENGEGFGNSSNANRITSEPRNVSFVTGNTVLSNPSSTIVGTNATSFTNASVHGTISSADSKQGNSLNTPAASSSTTDLTLTKSASPPAFKISAIISSVPISSGKNSTPLVTTTVNVPANLSVSRASNAEEAHVQSFDSLSMTTGSPSSINTAPPSSGQKSSTTRGFLQGINTAPSNKTTQSQVNNTSYHTSSIGSTQAPEVTGIPLPRSSVYFSQILFQTGSSILNTSMSPSPSNTNSSTFVYSITAMTT